MGRLRTLTILLTLGAWGAATEGSPPDQAAPGTDTAARPPSPVAPVKYLEAGARLFNSGQYDLAAKYISAAQAYRDQLSASERTVLDAYLREMAKAPTTAAATLAPAPTEAAPAPAPVLAPAPAPANVVAPTIEAAAPASIPAPARAGVAGADEKQQAKWLLSAAREQARMGNYDDAEKKVTDARALNVRWGLFDDTPAKVADAIAKARPKAVAALADPALRKDRTAAKAKLKEARAAMAGKNFEQAEAIAMDVKTWNLTYGMFEDTPDKVAAAARALRRRDVARNTIPSEQPSQGVYDVLVQEARQLASAGKLAEAEAKAKQAQRMNVVPSVTADRAEAVLHDVAMARARQTSKNDQAVQIASAERPAPAVQPAESPSEKAEREANRLLAKGDGKAASAKFAEAESLRAREAGEPLAAGAEPVVLSTSDDNAKPDVPVVPLPDQAPTPAPSAIPATVPSPAPPMPAPAPISKGEQVLMEATALYRSGNYPAAKQKAEEAKAAKLGVDTQADEMLAQIALAAQSGSLSLYESALDSVRKGDVARAKSLLTEVMAANDSQDDGLRAKAQSLFDKLPKDDSGKATVGGDKLAPAEDSDTLHAQKLNAEVGT